MESGEALRIEMRFSMNHDLKYDLSSFREDLKELSVSPTGEQEEHVPNGSAS